MTKRPLSRGLGLALRALPPAPVNRPDESSRCVITRHGRHCQAIVPLADLDRHSSGGALLALCGTGSGTWPGDARALVRALRDEWT